MQCNCLLDVKTMNSNSYDCIIMIDYENRIVGGVVKSCRYGGIMWDLTIYNMIGFGRGLDVGRVCKDEGAVCTTYISNLQDE